MHRGCTVAPDAAEPIACAPYPSPGSSGNGPWVLCSTSTFPILQYIVVGGYSRLPDLYTATGSSRRENRPEGESERSRQRGRERRGRRLRTGRTVPLFNRTSETLFVVGNHKNTILCANTGPRLYARNCLPYGLIRDVRWESTITNGQVQRNVRNVINKAEDGETWVGTAWLNGVNRWRGVFDRGARKSN